MAIEENSSTSLVSSERAVITRIGARVRDSRLALGLTLQQLSQSAGVSQSMLSLVERGKSSASIGTLIAISNALGAQISELLSPEGPVRSDTVVRAAEQPMYETAQGVTWRVVRQDRARGLEIAINEYMPETGTARSPIHHKGYEYGLVLEGEVTVEVDGTTYVLQRGDTIAYSSTKDHKIWNYGRTRARTLWVITT